MQVRRSGKTCKIRNWLFMYLLHGSTITTLWFWNTLPLHSVGRFQKPIRNSAAAVWLQFLVFSMAQFFIVSHTIWEPIMHWQVRPNIQVPNWCIITT